jgi:hypothetical protein
MNIFCYIFGHRFFKNVTNKRGFIFCTRCLIETPNSQGYTQPPKSTTSYTYCNSGGGGGGNGIWTSSTGTGGGGINESQ